MQMTEPYQKPDQINVCTYCKEQVNPKDLKTHAEECALIPEDHKKSLAETHHNVYETLDTDITEDSSK
jgi:hypothetical protein